MATKDTIISLYGKLKTFIRQHDLDHGNAELNIQKNPNDDVFDLYVTLDAPHNTTITIRFDDEILNIEDKDLDRFLKESFGKGIHNFNGDAYFEEVWSPQFSEVNEWSVFEFMDMIRSDMAFYKQIATEWENETLLKQDVVTYIKKCFGITEADIVTISKKCGLPLEKTIRYIKEYPHNILDKKSDILGIFFFDNEYTRDDVSKEAAQLLDVPIDVQHVDNKVTTLADYFIRDRGDVVELEDGRIIYVIRNYI